MGARDYLGEFENVVLLALARLEDDAYGMTIHEEILETTGRDVSIPAVYVTLSRLEKKEYVVARVEAGSDDRDGRARKFYRLAPAGVEALERSRAMLDQLWDGVRLQAGKGRAS
jgi:DNA-binding PadR family transcriptional regulator